jgi:GAF domain/ANTAR domain
VNGERDDGHRQSRETFSRSGKGLGRSVFTGVAQLCQAAVRMTGVDGAATALLTERSQVRELVYATDPIAQRIDELQFTLGEGPCLDACLQMRPQLVPDLGDPAYGTRWPIFVSEAVGVGVAAVFAFPIAGDDSPLGVLELYRATPGALTGTQYQAAVACAAEAGTTVRNNWSDYLSRARELGSSADALAVELSDPTNDEGFSRSRVFMASGMLAVQWGIVPEDAMDRLRAYSFRSGRSINDVATDVIGRRLSHIELSDGQDNP